MQHLTALFISISIVFPKIMEATLPLMQLSKSTGELIIVVRNNFYWSPAILWTNKALFHVIPTTKKKGGYKAIH